jgi:hypothetical protein
MADDVVERVFRHLDNTENRELRTVKGIAAILRLDPKDVMTAIYQLEVAGRVKGEPRKDGLETWRTAHTPPSTR